MALYMIRPLHVHKFEPEILVCGLPYAADVEVGCTTATEDGRGQPENGDACNLLLTGVTKRSYGMA